MRLYEYMSKKILSDYGIPVPRGVLAADSSVPLDNLNFPIVIKAQILVGGRGKAGGIKIANSSEEAKNIIKEMIRSKIKDIEVQKVLVEEKADVLKELYMGIYLDRDHSTALLMFSEYGGVDIEEVEHEKIFKVEVNPLIGIQSFMIRKLLEKTNLEKNLLNEIGQIVPKIYKIFNDYALLVEINPLGITKQGQLIALDAKIIVDDNAIFRHKDLQNLERGMTEFEKKTSELNVTGVEVTGDIAVITSGAGCLMGTIDTIKSYEGNIGPMIDLGGSVFQLDKINDTISGCISAIKKLKPKVIIFNAYFQLARCNFLAEAIKVGLEKNDGIPVVVRLKGRADDEAEKILKDVPNVYFTKSFEEACEKAVQLAKGA
jgi:succinyl-CoA synthetase beta subunit